MTKAELAAAEALAPLKEMYGALPWALGIGFAVFVVLSVLLAGRGPRRMSHSAASLAGMGIGMLIFDGRTAMDLAFMPFVVLLAAAGMAYICVNAARIKGAVGEGAVRKLLEQRGYQALHDVCLPSRNGTTQIDHVVRAGGALVCVETKNYDGAIYGDAKRPKWTQALAGGRIKNGFMNPLHQNHGHVRALEAAVGGPVDGIVVFVGGATFPKGMPEGVLALDGLAHHLAALAKRSPDARGSALRWERLKHAAEEGRGRAARSDHKRTVLEAKAASASRSGAGGAAPEPAKPRNSRIGSRIEPRF